MKNHAVLEGLLEHGVGARLVIGRGESLQRADQRLGDEAPAEAAEVALGIGPGVVIGRGFSRRSRGWVDGSRIRVRFRNRHGGPRR